MRRASGDESRSLVRFEPPDNAWWRFQTANIQLLSSELENGRNRRVNLSITRSGRAIRVEQCGGAVDCLLVDLVDRRFGEMTQERRNEPARSPPPFM
jgi:hypothetical protein